MIKTNWITIDLDKPSRADILRVWYNLRLTKPRILKGRISSGGEGIHIAAMLPHAISEYDMLEARRALGDDPQRIYFDETRPESKPSQILFDTKRGRRAGEWTEDIEHLQRMYRP